MKIEKITKPLGGESNPVSLALGADALASKANLEIYSYLCHISIFIINPLQALGIKWLLSTYIA